jgi:Fur family ferric uptake transcriptional regulator
MTEAPRVRPLPFTDLDEAITALRQRGLRLSTPRRLVLEALFEAEGPVSAEHLSTRLGLDAGSVYRNLETLEAHGVVKHVHLGHGPGLHALVGPGEREYLYCDRCGAARSLPPEERLALGITPGTVRVSVGIEDPEDVLEDFRQAIAR